MAYESIFSHITDNLEFRLEVMTPAAYGGSIIEELVAVPLTGTQSDKLIKRIYNEYFIKLKYHTIYKYTRVFSLQNMVL